MRDHIVHHVGNGLSHAPNIIMVLKQVNGWYKKGNDGKKRPRKKIKIMSASSLARGFHRLNLTDVVLCVFLMLLKMAPYCFHK